jgi:hypothetical protein
VAGDLGESRCIGHVCSLPSLDVHKDGLLAPPSLRSRLDIIRSPGLRRRTHSPRPSSAKRIQRYHISLCLWKRISGWQVRSPRTSARVHFPHELQMAAYPFTRNAHLEACQRVEGVVPKRLGRLWPGDICHDYHCSVRRRRRGRLGAGDQHWQSGPSAPVAECSTPLQQNAGSPSVACGENSTPPVSANLNTTAAVS